MKLKFGMVGGGNGAFIGNVHRRGALMDDLAELVAGCFTRDEAKNLAAADEWGVKDLSRVYKNFAEMAEKEAEREDGIDFACIAAPNDVHYDACKAFMEKGIHIVCDKPLALTTSQALELEKMATDKDLLFGVTYTYAAYAMITQARHLIDSGVLGDIVYINAEYPQDWVAVDLSKGGGTAWRFDPKRLGPSLCTADIGTHLEYLIKAATGLKLKSVLARFDHIPSELALETNTTVMLKYENDIPGLLWASQVAIGDECGVRIRVFGNKGSLEWTHEKAGTLKVALLNEPVQYYSAKRDYNCEHAKTLSRLPYGHPEGYFEAFGNLYRSFCECLKAKIGNREVGDFRFSNVHDGVEGMRFIDACIESDSKGNVWVDLVE